LPSSRRSFALSAAAVLCSHARAQDEPTFSTGVKVVSVLAGVTTRQGQILRDLTKDDFLLSEDGRPQTIRYFSRETDLPLTLGLMVDTSMSQRRVMDSERSASFRFFDRVLRENKDQIFIMQFDTGVYLSQKLTSSRRDLEQALSLVDTPTFKELRAQGGGGTALYDAVIKASSGIMKEQHDRKALILLTDGVDVGSQSTLSAAIEAAQRSDTLVYTILFSDSGSHEGSGVLQRLSRETGGGYFAVSKKQNIEMIFDLVQEELRSQYSLGYISDRPVRFSEFRKIQLTTRQKGLIVQARERYYARP
jgi:VWFA-related protein